MIQSFIRLVRGYTDALFAVLIKAAKDGKKVFYPWGSVGRGYVLPNEEAEERLKQQYAVFQIALSFLLGVGAFLGGFAAGFAVLVLCIIGYAVQVKRLVAGMESSDEGYSWMQANTAMARAFTPRQLWSWASGGILLIGIGLVLILVEQPGHMRPEFGILPELGLLLGGGILLLAFTGWMLFLRRGADPPTGAPSPVVKSIVAEEAAFHITGLMGPVRSWFLAIFGVVFAGAFIYLLVTDGEARSREGFGGALLFALIAALGISQLVLRYRERHR
jgi:hypothetical protein